MKVRGWQSVLAIAAVHAGCVDDPHNATTCASLHGLTVVQGTTVRGLYETPFVFGRGVQAFQTSEPTTVTIHADLRVDIVVGAQAATGQLRFGSCHFAIDAGSGAGALAPGSSVVAKACTLAWSSASVCNEQQAIRLDLDGDSSDWAPASVIALGGELTINGVPVDGH